ncbi:tetratricopeptide repeat protein [Virgisporangium ochraceum]|uniref:Peptidase S41 n=1 Tax=Virgisporangium ochraceum TaxID=65505 RepID=A0A8J3ZWY4_9ACTN|nr:tetratricopeptide repeat protein [Virgisporangium ochraceum]GIJ69020.1 peptidase S41 [Virgisporangium ochraceum]
MADQVGMVAAAEEATRAGDLAAAARRWQAVVEVNPVNGIFWARLGLARFGTGDHAGALDAYRRATELGVWPIARGEPIPPIFPGELAYEIARCLAALGEREAAVESLAEAVRQGLRDPGRARSDLEQLADHPRFEGLVGPAGPADGASRDDRWRSDLRFLRGELARRVPRPDVLDSDFHAAVDALDRAVPDLDDGRVVVGIWRLLRRLGDGHAWVSVEDSWPEWTRALPVWFFQFGTSLLVTEAEPRFGHLAGAEVLAVDGHPVAEVLDALDPLLTRDNPYTPLARGPMWLRVPAYLRAVGMAERPDRVTLTVRLLSGEVTDAAVEAGPPLPEPRTWMNARPRSWPSRCPPDSVRPPFETPAYLRDVENPFWFEYQAAGNLVYFQFNGVRDKDDDTLAACYERVFAAVAEHDAGALVVDLRWNGGGNTWLGQPLVHHVLAHPRLPVFVIVGRGTFSAAQNTATLLDRHTHAVFVGEPTGSAPNFVGEAVPFRLPGSGVLVNVSDLYWQTSWPFDHRIAIAPRIYAPPTAEAYLAGRDPAMDAVREQLAR